MRQFGCKSRYVRVTLLAWGVLVRETGRSGLMTRVGYHRKKKGEHEKLNHESAVKALPVSPTKDARPNCEKTARGGRGAASSFWPPKGRLNAVAIMALREQGTCRASPGR